MAGGVLDILNFMRQTESAKTRTKLAVSQADLAERTEERLEKSARASKKLSALRGAYFEALTANQNLQNTITDKRIESDIDETNRQAAANKSRATGFQADLYGMKVSELEKMMKGPEEERQKARNIAIGYTASQDAAMALKGLTLQNQQMNTAINLMGQRMQQDAQNRDAISDALELVMAGAGGIGEKAFGKEQFNTLANVLYQNAIKAALPGGELVPSSVVPEIAPQDPGIMSKIGNLLGFGGGGAATQTKVDPGTSGLEADEDLEAGLRNLQK